MAGRIRQRGQDADGKYREACKLLALRLGYPLGEVWFTWSQMALQREHESWWRIPRECHEEMAFVSAIEIFDKRGEEGN